MFVEKIIIEPKMTNPFIVIEGLDGSGKSSATKRLAEILNERFAGAVKTTFEPNDFSAGGQFIRDVLTKKIVDFHPRQLAFSFAANRLDHCTRTIGPWLSAGLKPADGAFRVADPHQQARMILCDRFYMSSLVYQSFEDFGMEAVFELNKFAKRPDLTFFIDVSDEICYQRMAIRNQPKELFEEKLAQTREKYRAAISFLKEKTGAEVVEIDGSGTVNEVANLILKEIEKRFPNWA